MRQMRVRRRQPRRLPAEVEDVPLRGRPGAHLLDEASLLVEEIDALLGTA